MRDKTQPTHPCSGMTLIELMVVVALLGSVMLTLMGILLSTSRLHSKTSSLAGIQTSAREGVSLMETEIREAGADPGDPQIGVVGIVAGQANLIHVRADLNGDGVITTTEPSEDVTYSYNAATKSILRNPGSGAVVVVPNVKAMTLTYYDGSNAVLGTLPLSVSDAALVRAVGLTITAQDADSMGITLSTRISLRNM